MENPDVLVTLINIETDDDKAILAALRSIINIDKADTGYAYTKSFDPVQMVINAVTEKLFSALILDPLLNPLISKWKQTIRAHFKPYRPWRVTVNLIDDNVVIDTDYLTNQAHMEQIWETIAEARKLLRAQATLGPISRIRIVQNKMKDLMVLGYREGNQRPAIYMDLREGKIHVVDTDSPNADQ